MNKEYAENLAIAVDFIERVLAKKVVDPETFFFSIQYFFLILDEEHSNLTSFRHIGQLRSFNMTPTLMEGRGVFEVFDNNKKTRILRINGKPTMHYINRIMADFT